MDDVCLDVDGGSAFDVVLPSRHKQWGSRVPFREAFSSVPRREENFVPAALSPRLDPSCLTGRDAGCWETGHV